MAELSTDDGSVPSQASIDRFNLSNKIQKIEGAFDRIGGIDPDEDWDIEELSVNLEPGDMVRVIYNIGLVLRG